uniref:Crystaline entomocidal protoxin n=1 Tax=Bacillus thuringiensis TaxID=1428 RepID=A0A7R6AZ64_BACTU|nr:Cry protein [Bacillus thuringiensis]
MNQNYGSNEVEILNSRNMSCQPRYPFAKAPSSKLHSMGYKDYMERRTKGVETYSGLDGLRTSISIVLSLISNIPGPLAVPAKFISIIFPFLWPSGSQQAMWEAFMKAAEEMINQKIEAFARNQAISRLTGVQDVVSLYQRDAKNFNDYPTSEPLKRQVREQFISTNTFVTGSMPLFAVGGQELPLLTTYVEAANLHLLLLRDAVMFGESWGMDPLTVAGYQSDLNTRIAVYTDYCVRIYNQGLQKAKTLQANVDRKYRMMEEWNLFNKYRRDMTLMVLDLVAVWQTYSPQLYRIGTRIELTREIFTDLRGNSANIMPSNGWTSADIMEGYIMPPPSLSTWLDYTDIWTQRGTGVASTEQYAGVQNRYKYTLDNQIRTSPLLGRREGVMHTVLASPTIINRVDNRVGTSLYTFSFYREGSASPFQTFGDTFSQSNSIKENRIPIEGNQTRANHRMSRISGMENVLYYFNSNGNVVTTPKYMFCMAEGWTHISMSPENRILSDSITQIPAVKGNVVDNGATVVRGPGSTGGDLVRLPAYNQQWTQLRVKVRPSTTARTRRYNVRIRYASEANANLFVGKYVDAANRWYETGDYAVNRTISGSMTYSSFQYLDTIFFAANEEEFKIELRCNSGGPIYIDKIEFIPANPIPEPPVIAGTY